MHPFWNKYLSLNMRSHLLKGEKIKLKKMGQAPFSFLYEKFTDEVIWVMLWVAFAQFFNYCILKQTNYRTVLWNIFF